MAFIASKPDQIAVITSDIEKAKKAWAAFYGVEVPPTADGGVYENTRCEYFGEPNKTASCKMAFFNFDNGLQMEIIEPYGGDSTWQDFLNETGGGIHHMGYVVKDIKGAIKACEENGYKMTMKGYYGDGSGIYIYYDARETLGCFVELLHSFDEETIKIKDELID